MSRKKTKRRPRRWKNQAPDPTSKEIAAACAAIRACWTPQQWRERDVRTSAFCQRRIRELAESILPPLKVGGGVRLRLLGGLKAKRIVVGQRD